MPGSTQAGRLVTIIVIDVRRFPDLQIVDWVKPRRLLPHFGSHWDHNWWVRAGAEAGVGDGIGDRVN